MRTLTRWLLTLGAIATTAAVAYALYLRFSVPLVTVTEAVEGPVVHAFYATGTLSPEREHPVKANVEGTLIEVFVDRGSPVTKGQTVARVYVEEYLLKRAQAAADLELKKQLADPENSPVLQEFDARVAATEKQLEVAMREQARLSQIREPGARTLTELDRAEELVKTTRSLSEGLRAAKAAKMLEFQRDVKTAQAQLEIADWNITQQTIASPVDGVVLDWPTSAGTRVRVNDLIATVADVHPDRLVMRTNVDEEDKTRVRIGQGVQITLYAYPEQVFEGTVRTIYPKADPARRTFEVDVEVLHADEAFAAGMTGELAFIVARKESAVVVPSQALQRGALWLVREGRLVKAEAALGLRSIERTEVLSGLSPGEQVVISPIGDLQEGQNVRMDTMDPAAAAGANSPKTRAPSTFRGLK
jgi:RND family efflux transporter MFP subunit